MKPVLIMRTPFTGVGTALVTPFTKSGDLDEAAVRRLARRHPRWGYKRIHARLVKLSWTVNGKRVRRLRNELGPLDECS